MALFVQRNAIMEMAASFEITSSLPSTLASTIVSLQYSWCREIGYQKEADKNKMAHNRNNYDWLVYCDDCLKQR